MNLEERVATYSRAFVEAGGPEALGEAEKIYIEEALIGSSSGQVDLDLDEIAWSFESLGLETFNAEASETTSQQFGAGGAGVSRGDGRH